ncbi:hypothetical protein [Rhizobium sp. CG5]|uniref:hypothetical protein n=1 Tax=Rhizobium sp. CG5 TaxID=2726076 RepID=UPI002034A66F|nr:hypothetical protein [Rhizobium sp. CG5]
MSLAVDFTFKGRIACDSFLSFARHRAGRLDLKLDIGSCSETAVEVSVEGAEALVDMFEMACSLGPYDCMVLDVLRKEGIAARPPAV